MEGPLGETPTDEELLAEAERQAAGEPRRFGWGIAWLRRTKKDPEEEAKRNDLLDQAFARGSARRWPEFCTRFDKGELFRSQHIDFTSMLLVKEDELEGEINLWDEVCFSARWAGMADSPKLLEMKAFVETRLSMDARTRAKILAPDGSFRPLASLSKGAQDSLVAARERFVAVAVKYRWWWASSDAVERERLKAEYSKDTP